MRHFHLISLALYALACSGDTKDTDSESESETGDTAASVDLGCPEGTRLGISSSTGCITGDEEGNIEQWIGVPYAQPPVGDLRFARTVPVEPWTEPLDAEDFGEVCLQWFFNGVTNELVGDEDCLSLNIFRPEDTEVDAGLPILFFTHGGSYTSGAGSLESYALEPELAERAIVVTHNYRLGPFGFMPHEDLTEEDGDSYGGSGSSGNQGLFDSLTALQWVVENAVAMGGDPSRLMVFGESAGGTTTCALLASPLAEGLFSAALIQSVGCGFMEWPLRELSGTDFTFSAEDYGDYIASELDCDGSGALPCLRDLEPEDIMTTLAAYSFSVNVDQVFLPRPAREAFSEGDFNQVPVLAGFNENEGVLFTYAMGIDTEEALLSLIEAYATDYGFSDSEVLAQTYTSDAFGTPQQAFDAFYGDLIFSCPTRSFLQAVSAHVDTRAYFFSEAPDWLQHYAEYENWGAFHTAELPFIFGTNPEYYSEPEQALSQIMQAAWVSSVDSPTVEGIGDWPLFVEGGGVSSDGGTFVEFNGELTATTSGVFQNRCDLLEELGWQTY
jgi:para-nitrobenzyl esterase